MLAAGARVCRLGGMKLPVVAAKVLFTAAWLALVVPLGAQTAPAPKPVAPSGPGKKPADAPAEAPAVIPGLELPRNDGTFLGLTVENTRMILKFYDADKKPAPINLARAAARWNPVNKIGDERSVLNPNAQNDALVSTPVVRPPLVFKVYLTLLDENGAVVESIIADMRKLDSSPAK